MKKEFGDEKTLVSCPMTKDLLMKYTFVSLCIIAAIAILPFGTVVLIMIVVSVMVATASDYLIFIISKKQQLRDTYSSAVCGMIVALSSSSGTNNPYLIVGVTSAIAVILFKKVQGLLGRKYLNPAAAAKLLVLAPVWSAALIPREHLIVNLPSFSSLYESLQACYSYTAPFKDPLLTLSIMKNHGWLGGASSIAVVAVGTALIVLSRGYIKWKIPLTYLVTIGIVSMGYGLVYGEDVVLRVAFHVLTGSVIFLAFFMATDPATTPLTNVGQIIFAFGLGILTFVFQMSILFLGGSILALVLMNLTAPLLDKVGLPKPSEKRITRRPPKSKRFEAAPVTGCIRCGKCLVTCCKGLSPILIKEAVDRGNWVKVRNMRVELCEDCGLCSYVCPSRIDLKGTMIYAKQRTKEFKAIGEMGSSKEA
jgi:electron transport complex protein RnfD